VPAFAETLRAGRRYGTEAWPSAAGVNSSERDVIFSEESLRMNEKVSWMKEVSTFFKKLINKDVTLFPLEEIDCLKMWDPPSIHL